MKKESDQKQKWREYYIFENELNSYIEKNTETLVDQSTIDFERQKANYTRIICYTLDPLILHNIELKIEELKSKYLLALGRETARLGKNFPIILRNVENININSNNAIQSIQINRHTKKNMDQSFLLIDFYESEKKVSKIVFELKDKYNFILSKEDILDDKTKEIIDRFYTLSIKGEDLLNFANADILQLHQHTGKQFILNVRKKGENRSTRYKFGYVILDRKPNINNSNKEAKRTHTLSNKYEEFNPGFDTFFNIYIKEKRSNQINMF